MEFKCWCQATPEGQAIQGVSRNVSNTIQHGRLVTPVAGVANIRTVVVQHYSKTIFTAGINVCKHLKMPPAKLNVAGGAQMPSFRNC